MAEPTSKEQVFNPPHYDIMPGVSAIKLIASAMTEDEFYGYCLGNTIKYRSRAGKKHPCVESCLSKADNHTVLFNNYKHLCRETSLRHA